MLSFFWKVLYTVEYASNSTDIVAVMVEFVLGSVTAERGLGLKQKVSISYSKVHVWLVNDYRGWQLPVCLIILLAFLVFLMPFTIYE